MIKQHLHKDFVYKALSQGWEAPGWRVEPGLRGRGLRLVSPPPHPPAQHGIVCVVNKALFIPLFPSSLDVGPFPSLP